jgi:HEAT repeat protein
LLPYGTVTENDLPQCTKAMPRLKSKTWWLTKQTWTFQSAEMRDLQFQPAVLALAAKLSRKEGYFAAANLASLGTNGATALLSALHETNSIVRLNVATVLETIKDPRVVEHMDSLLADPQPEVRAHAIFVAMDHWNAKFIEKLVGLLRDPYREIRHEAEFALREHHDAITNYIPVFRQMLQDTNPGVQAAGLNMLHSLQIPIQREQLLQFLKLPDMEAISLVLAQLRDNNATDVPSFINETSGISDTEAIPLLQNNEPMARLVGLKILYQNAEPQSVELAIPLLNDPEPAVRLRTARTLRALTGQHFTDEQPRLWQEWWTANKTNFVVELHPEELRPRFPGSPAGDIGGRPPPATPKENFPH